MRIKFDSSFKRFFVDVPYSKSMSARALIIQALSNNSIPIYNLSESKDTTELQQALAHSDGVFIHTGDGGTSFRFFLAYAALRISNCIIHTGKQMSLRPIGPLVEALNELGADVECMIHEGFPPVQICGTTLSGNSLSIKADLSSQFITSLMLIAPYLKDGLSIHLKDTLVSKPYVEMTASMMRTLGIDIIIDGQCIKISKGHYVGDSIQIESDWSSAAFWLAYCALLPRHELSIHGHFKNSIQGDKFIAALLQDAGLTVNLSENNLIVERDDSSIELKDEYDLMDTPDLAPVLICLAAALKQKVLFKGLNTLEHKESNRIVALQTELNKCGVLCENADQYSLKVDGSGLHKPIRAFSSHGDHRIIMALMLFSSVFEEIEIDEYNSVTKSYPDFIQQLKKNGFQIFK
ncbi:MAG TPA: hypothetical protein PKH65_04445 [Bacteroidia bacterium]|nr:hypothetical protein [Bacteroidia bacterium]HNT79909.1 hypothetical protein [Bacteroidia bacterium]